MARAAAREMQKKGLKRIRFSDGRIITGLGGPIEWAYSNYIPGGPGRCSYVSKEAWVPPWIYTTLCTRSRGIWTFLGWCKRDISLRNVKKRLIVAMAHRR